MCECKLDSVDYRDAEIQRNIAAAKARRAASEVRSFIRKAKAEEVHGEIFGGIRW